MTELEGASGPRYTYFVCAYAALCGPVRLLENTGT